MDFYKDEERSAITRRWIGFQSISFAIIITLSFVLTFVLISKGHVGASNYNFISYAGVAFITSAVYYYAYKSFDEDKFYFFICVHWFANFVYLIPQAFINPSENQDSFDLIIYALSSLSSIFLWIAIFSFHGKKNIVLKRVVTSLLIAVILCVINRLIYNEVNPSPRAKYYWVYLIGSTFAFSSLWAAGWLLATHLNLQKFDVRNYRLIILITFWGYALMQYLGPFQQYIRVNYNNEYFLIFGVAELLKILNVIAIMGVTRAAAAYKEVKSEDEARFLENEVRMRESELKAERLRIQAEEEKIQRESQYAQLGKLAASIKHDVNTPLATMSFDIAALKERFQHDKGTIARLTSLEESMQRISATVKVVDYFQGDKAFYNRERMMSKANLLELVYRAVRSVKNEVEGLKLNSPRSRIKVRGKDVSVRANGPMFEQLIVNIIKNGLEGIEEAGRERGLIEINVGPVELPDNDSNKHWAKVEITDNGAGIPEENMDKLTTVFTTRSHKKANSGIGLFIGKKIIDIHDGDIKFESKLGEWTKVTLLLPELRVLGKQHKNASNTENASDSVSVTSSDDMEVQGDELKDMETGLTS